MPAEIGGDHGRSHSIFNSDQFLDLMLKPKSWIFILRISQKILLTLRGEPFWCRHCFSLVLQWLKDTFSLPFLDLAYIARSASLKLLTIAFWKQPICFWCYVQNVWTLAFVSNALAHILSGFYQELSIQRMLSFNGKWARIALRIHVDQWTLIQCLTAKCSIFQLRRQALSLLPEYLAQTWTLLVP